MINERGQIMILSFAVLGVVLFSTILTIAGAQLYGSNANYSAQAEKVTAIAEAGLDKAIASLNKTGGSYNGESETLFMDGSYSVTITSLNAGTKLIQSTAYLPNRQNPKVKRTVSIQASIGTGISFNYGLQIGDGGFEMGNSATLNGSIYSNGNISGENNDNITGDVWVAGGAQASADQQSDCTDPNCLDYIFGKIINGENRLDVAQSFKPSAENNLNKVQLKLKKVGSPANPTVKIMADISGKPDKNNILTSGILSADLVGSQYSFVDVSFSSTPKLDANTTYWIMISANNLDSSNYWVWSLDSANGYNLGSAAYSANWQAKNPVWTNIPGDLGFKTFMGGSATSISLGNGSTVSGNVHANTINGLTINKDAYYQTILNSTVKGVSYPGSTDPPPLPFPISEANITDWQNAAAAAGTSTGDITSCTQTIGPGKIVGNINLGNNCNITVKTPLWITGNITIGNSNIFTLDSSFGAASGVILVDGTLTLGNGCDFKGSGTAGSYLMVVSNFNSKSNGTVAINAGDSSISGIFYAPSGSVQISNGATFTQISAWQLDLGNNSQLNYKTGLANLFFTSGPSGSFSLIKGTYQTK